MTMNTDFRVAVVNYSGNTGKTTVSRVLLKMRMPDAEIISIEGANADGLEDKNGQIVRATKFKQIHQALMYSPSVILDIGSTSLEETMHLISQMSGSHDDIDYFVVPVTQDVKIRRDSIKTVHELLKVGVPPQKIKVVFNKVGLTESVEDVFDVLIHALKKLGVPYDIKNTIYSNGFYPDFENTGMGIEDFKDKIMSVSVEDNKKRMNELRRNRNRTELENEEFTELMNTLQTQQLAISTAIELDAVFKNLFKDEIINDEPVVNDNDVELKEAIEKLDTNSKKSKG